MKQVLAKKIPFLFLAVFLLSTHSYIFGQEMSASFIPSEVESPTAPAEVPGNEILNSGHQTTPEITPLKKAIFEALPEDTFWQHVRFGGSLGASFSNNNFSGYLAPKAVYDFNSIFSAGVGIMGSYTDGSNYTAWTYGGSVIGLARPLTALQLSAEFEENYVSRNYEFDGDNFDENYWTPALFVGIGYTTGNVTVGVRYDVLHDDKSVYADAFMPFVSIFF